MGGKSDANNIRVLNALFEEKILVFERQEHFLRSKTFFKKLFSKMPVQSKLSEVSRIVEMEYIPDWMRHSPVFQEMCLKKEEDPDASGSDDEEDDEEEKKLLVDERFVPVTFEQFKRRFGGGKSMMELRFDFFIHYLRMMDFWDVSSAYWSKVVFFYFYFNRNRNYRSEIPEDLQDNLLSSHSFGCYIGENIEWRDLPSLAAEMGNIPFLEFLKKKGLRYNEYTFQAAVSSGQMAVCEYLLKEGCKMNSYTTASAAKAGQFEILKFLVENGCQMTSHVVTNASKLGNIDIAKWAVGMGVEINHYAVSEAINCENYELIVFFQENGFKFGYGIARVALRKYLETKNTRIFEYIRQNTKQSIIDFVVQETPIENVERMKLLYDLGRVVDFYLGMDVSAFGDVETMKFLLDNGLDFYQSFYGEALLKGNEELISFFDENGYGRL